MQLAQHYRTTRQPRRMSGEGMAGQRLIFLYPFIVDTTMFRYSNMCRDFFTVSFINEIKIDNVLNIISTANQNVGTIGSGNNQINPAAEIYKVTRQTDPNAAVNSANYQPEADPYTYQERIAKINDYLQHQLKHDPRFSTHRPIFTNIAINHVLDVPLIIGTQSYQVTNEFLYLQLMISIMYDIKWNSEADVHRINTILAGLAKNPGTFMKLLHNDETRHEFEIDANLKGAANKDLLQSEDFTSAVGTKLQQFIKGQASMNEIFVGMVFNKRKWTANFPFTNTNNNLTFNSINVDTTRTQKRHYESSISTISSYLAEYIIPALHSLDIFAGPTHPSRNVPDKINSFITELLDGLSDDFVQLSGHINQGLIKLNAESMLASVQQTSENVAQMKSLCEDNVSLGGHVTKILNDFRKPSRIPINFDMTALMSFVDLMSVTGNQFNALSGTVDSWLKFLSQQEGGQQLTQTVNRIQSEITDKLKQLLYGQFPVGSGHGPWIDIGTPVRIFTDVFANYSSVAEIGPRDDVQYHMNYFKQYVNDIETSLREMIIFFVKWIFFSYSCDYLKDIEIDVEIQKRDAMDFPNYCLVLPERLFKDLYVAVINKNFKNMLTRDDLTPETIDVRAMSFNFGDIKGIFDTISKKLNIPNLIVVDEKMKICHYQFMYMDKPNKINFSTMESFIQHQKDVLPGF